MNDPAPSPRAAANPRAIRFVLDDEIVEVADPPPTRTLLQYLREDLGRCGTKEGCAEGDCGACTTVLGELRNGAIEYSAINSCIRFLPTVDGMEVVTVESLGDGARLHPVQQALVDHHASQCGFCTPGFVMSLFALYLERERPAKDDVIDALSGNLCRCTGYRPIVDAATHADDYPVPAKWSREDAQSPTRRERLQSIRRSHPLACPGFHAPQTLDELASAFAQSPGSLVLAGGTDVALWVTKLMRELPPIIYIGRVEGLGGIIEGDGMIEIGAAVSLAEAYRAIVASYPMLGEIANRFGSVPIRNSGTLCGNLANGSPIGDSMPILIALGAELRLRRGDETRSLPLERFYLGYQKNALGPGEFVQSVRVPLPCPGRMVASYKVSKRFDQDISAVCGAYAIDVKDGNVVSARIAYGGMAAIPQRAARAEVALAGRPWSATTIIAACEAIGADYQPMTDMRASAAYRARVAGSLLQRFYLEHSPESPVTRVHDAALLS
ncbi:MAG: xanthine dehydrogenase small subunit [Usitatibacter sp.]